MSEQDEVRVKLAEYLERDAGWVGGPIAGRMRHAASALRSASPKTNVYVTPRQLEDHVEWSEPTTRFRISERNGLETLTNQPVPRSASPEAGTVDPADFDALDDYFFGDAEGSKRAEEAWERISAALEPAPSNTSDKKAHEPPKGYQHYGCPTCGRVETLPGEPDESPPWCFHGDRMSWHEPHPETLAEGRWTRTVRVKVTREQ